MQGGMIRGCCPLLVGRLPTSEGAGRRPFSLAVRGASLTSLLTLAPAYRLGYDDIMRELLLSCGMIQTATGETEQPALKAPGKDADLTLRNLLEVVVWFQHNRPSGEASLGTEGLGGSARDACR